MSLSARNKKNGEVCVIAGLSSVIRTAGINSNEYDMHVQFHIHGNPVNNVYQTRFQLCSICRDKIKMTEKTSTKSHLADDVITVTPDDVTKTTGESVTSPWSREGAEFYFGCAVIVIGIVGIAANGLIVYALVASKQYKKHLLVINQNVLDLVSCIFLVIIYAVKISHVHLTGLLGYWLCMLLISEALLWVAGEGAVINLVIISIDRYLKVVHPVCSKKKLRNWMIYSAMAFCWLYPFVYNMYMAFSKSAVVDGVCYGYIMWEDQVGKVVHSAFYFLWYYVLVVLISALCYWRILAEIRRQARVMTNYNIDGMVQSDAAQAHAHHIQSSVIKTMILVCVFYAVSGLPTSAYYFLVGINLDVNLTLLDSGYYAVTFVAFLYVCMNPFIYATKFEPVRRYLKRLLLCQKDDQPTRTLQTITSHTAGKRNLREHQL